MLKNDSALHSDKTHSKMKDQFNITGLINAILHVNIQRTKCNIITIGIGKNI